MYLMSCLLLWQSVRALYLYRGRALCRASCVGRAVRTAACFRTVQLAVHPMDHRGRRIDPPFKAYPANPDENAMHMHGSAVYTGQQ